MHQELQPIFNFSITIREMIANTLMATVCGVFICFFYLITFRGVSYSVNLIISIVMLSMITALVMMVIGDNLALAFGMVGILSIIQFKAAMKEGAQDFMFLFFALAIGLACGEGLYLVASIGCLFIGLITTTMAHVLRPKQQQGFTLNITKTALSVDEDSFSNLLQLFCKKYRLVSAKASVKDNGALMKLSYSISMKKGSSSEAFVCAIKEVVGIKEVLLEFNEE